ncbi:glycosyltransferase family 2 protein [Granulosicoccaceae sp. 1_MG-2023]|nr:glycosyltransferase family 2 protein [Granulosicoccaceae sp. 1_MG-2023]
MQTENTSVSVIIPAYNEARVIGPTIRKILELYPDYELLVVDDGSTDGTPGVAREAGARVVKHPYNMGNGAAVKTGIRNASGDIVVLMDGDGQHAPEDIARFVKDIAEYDLVVGARGMDSQANVGRGLANWVYNSLASYVSNFKVRDLTSGFRAFRRETVLQFLSLFPNRFSYPTTSTLSYLRSGLAVKYIPIKAAKRVGKSKIRIFRDGIRFLLIILRIATLFSPLKVFIPVSFVFFSLGLSYYVYTFITAQRFTNMSALLLSVSVLIFMMGLISEQITQLRYDRVRVE